MGLKVKITLKDFTEHVGRLTDADQLSVTIQLLEVVAGYRSFDWDEVRKIELA